MFRTCVVKRAALKLGHEAPSVAQPPVRLARQLSHLAANQQSIGFILPVMMRDFRHYKAATAVVHYGHGRGRIRADPMKF